MTEPTALEPTLSHAMQALDLLEIEAKSADSRVVQIHCDAVCAVEDALRRCAAGEAAVAATIAAVAQASEVSAAAVAAEGVTLNQDDRALLEGVHVVAEAAIRGLLSDHAAELLPTVLDRLEAVISGPPAAAASVPNSPGGDA